MLPWIIAGGVVLWFLTATGVALVIGAMIKLADSVFEVEFEDRPTA